ncbi:hypothetical protein AKJ61_04405 [candidate division MSBL1 archaeon SCGC-AAA259B11]|uniref:Uncharacterized protein n=1 Tax=candidate division MSBL1 archaeon SCGC-AAA259B11 TaxID=1698260 RepID=A0A133U3B8_9EURY|nr:hypothetical protein AKJ61_04405 [candidate division MSBL1 archaeon SCGC-AAA259B11]
MVPSVEKNLGGEKLSIFEFGEAPEKSDDDGSKSGLDRVLEETAQGLPEWEKNLFRKIVDCLNHDDYDEYEHLPDDPEAHLAALCRHCRAEYAEYGRSNHHMNGFDQGMVRWTTEKFLNDRLSLNFSMSPKEKRNAKTWVEFEVEKVGLINKHEEFRPVVYVRESDHNGVQKKVRRIRSDKTYPTPLHALQWIEEIMDSHKFSADSYTPAE